MRGNNPRKEHICSVTADSAGAGDIFLLRIKPLDGEFIAAQRFFVSHIHSVFHRNSDKENGSEFYFRKKEWKKM